MDEPLASVDNCIDLATEFSLNPSHLGTSEGLTGIVPDENYP